MKTAKKRFCCTVCKNFFADISKHMKNIHSEKMTGCEMCTNSKTVYNNADLKHHKTFCHKVGTNIFGDAINDHKSTINTAHVDTKYSGRIDQELEAMFRGNLAYYFSLLQYELESRFMC